MCPNFTKINEYGFIEAPYRKIDKSQSIVSKEIVYLTADEEDKAELKSKKLKTGLSSFGDFSAW